MLLFRQLVKSIKYSLLIPLSLPVYRRKMSSTCLAVFDFDHTIINDNSDTYVCKLAPGGTISREIRDLYSTNSWTMYMCNIFKYLHESGIKESDIRSCMKEMTFVKGMKELLQFMKKEQYEVIIISDSNSVFIDQILCAAGLQDCVNKIYTNPAKFDESGCLQVGMYHTQDWCNLSTVNLCKGHILDSHIKSQEETGINYSKVIYVGDGKNDLCPSLKLSENDIIFPRRGYNLEKAILENKGEFTLKGKVVYWTDADDIKNTLLQELPETK